MKWGKLFKSPLCTFVVKAIILTTKDHEYMHKVTQMGKSILKNWRIEL
jgi:hypothetical protein